MKKVLLVFVVLLLIVGIPYMLWAWPTVTEVTIIDATNKIKKGETDDQFRIEAVCVDDDEVCVFRNDDVTYVFPFFIYLKWGSQNENTFAKRYAKTGTHLCIKSYGWRIELFSAFPNETSIWVKEGNSC